MAVDTIDFARKFTLISWAVAQPAAGSDWSVTVPAGEVWRLYCASSVLTTSSTVATRVPQFYIKDGAGNVVFKESPAAGQAASITGNWSILPGVANQQNNGVNIAPIPSDLVLPEGFVIGVQTANIAAADQWSAIVALIGQGSAL